jgi:hypothetical protein
MAEWARFAQAIHGQLFAVAQQSLGRSLQCSGTLSGEQPPFLLIRSDPEGILCLVQTDDLSSAELERPMTDTASLLVRGKVSAVFPTSRLVVIRARSVRFYAGQ